MHHDDGGMTNLIASLRELAGLFVEDSALALANIVVVVVAGIVAAVAPASSWLSGLILVCGCLAVLIGNVATARRR
jgi:hypothetical protein